MMIHSDSMGIREGYPENGTMSFQKISPDY